MTLAPLLFPNDDVVRGHAVAEMYGLHVFRRLRQYRRSCFSFDAVFSVLWRGHTPGNWDLWESVLGSAESSHP